MGQVALLARAPRRLLLGTFRIGAVRDDPRDLRSEPLREVGFIVEISASGGPLLERLLPYLPEELRVEGRLAHAGDLVTDPDLLRAAYIEASQWLRESVGVQLAGPPGSGPQVGLAYPDRPFVPREASSCGLTLNGKGLMSGDPEVRAFLSARLDACRSAGLLPGERDSDALLDALVDAILRHRREHGLVSSREEARAPPAA